MPVSFEADVERRDVLLTVGRDEQDDIRVFAGSEGKVVVGFDGTLRRKANGYSQRSLGLVFHRNTVGA